MLIYIHRSELDHARQGSRPIYPVNETLRGLEAGEKKITAGNLSRGLTISGVLVFAANASVGCDASSVVDMIQGFPASTLW